MLAAAVVVAALSGAATLAGSASGSVRQDPPSPPASVAPQAPADASSLNRIRRQLQKAPVESERFENFRLLTSLQVFGQAPRFELFSPDESASSVRGPGPVRYGGATHAEFLSQVTPTNFQAPVMNLSSGLFSLSNWLADRKREAQRKEAEARQNEKQE